MIVEYKLNIGEGGNTFHPPYIKRYAFFDRATKTYLGYVLDENERDYYVPDTLVVLTEEQAVQRCVGGDVERILAPGANSLNDAELESAVRAWYNIAGN